MTERTRGKRWDYNRLASDGERVQLCSGYYRRDTDQPSSVVSEMSENPIPEVENGHSLEEELRDGDKRLSDDDRLNGDNDDDVKSDQESEISDGEDDALKEKLHQIRQMKLENEMRQQEEYEQMKLNAELERKVESQRTEIAEKRNLLEQVSGTADEIQKQVVNGIDGNLDQFLVDRRHSVEHRENQRNIDRLVNIVESLSDDITDFINENPLREICNSIEDIDQAISQVEHLRSSFRSKQKELLSACWSNDKGSYRTSGECILDLIKMYIVDAKAKRKSIRNDEDAQKEIVTMKKSSKITFISEEVRRVINDLNKIFICDINLSLMSK